MNTFTGRYTIGFFACLLLFVILNLLAVQVQSDCGLLGALGMAGCADDISRAGFPLLVWEQGGFAYRSNFSLPVLITDVVIALGVSAAAGWAAGKYLKRG
ncbi:MAG: hypothetical protein HY260_04450 [Chloroflexi bacterium]|nr:hypothetical protein [Chloroflexota bacterium]